MHYAFDRWLAESFPGCPFERYADDAVVHCRTQRQAQEVLAALTVRMEQVGLQLHPEKTKIVYCRDDNRRQPWNGPVSFTFLGFTFRGRSQQNKHGRLFTGFAPAISDDALAAKGDIARAWQLARKTTLTWADLRAWINPVVRGWMNYYGRFHRGAISAARPHQPLHPAVAAQEVQAAPEPQSAQPGVGAHHRAVPGNVRALAMGHRLLVVRTRGAR